MIRHLLLCLSLLSLAASAQPTDPTYDRGDDNGNWSYGSEEGGGSGYLGVDIADVSAERLSELKLKEEHGAEITMVDQDAPAGKAGLHDHDVIVSVNGTAVESAAQLRRMIKEIPPGRVVNLGISRDGQPQTIKVQLADKSKSMAWEPKSGEFKFDMPKMPNLPDFDLPVTVVVVHSGLRSGLMVENITPQLGDFFGVKGGNGVLVRTVEKGSRGEKAGFRAGDVVVKVNNQPVHDASDFTHALRSSSGGTAAVTIMRDRKEQNLTLTLPEKKDSGSLYEDDLDLHEFTAETEQAMSRAENELARLGPVMTEKMQQALHSRDLDLRRLMDERLQGLQQKMHDNQQEMQERQQKMRHELSRDWAEI